MEALDNLMLCNLNEGSSKISSDNVLPQFVPCVQFRINSSDKKLKRIEMIQKHRQMINFKVNSAKFERNESQTNLLN